MTDLELKTVLSNSKLVAGFFLFFQLYLTSEKCNTVRRYSLYGENSEEEK